MDIKKMTSKELWQKMKNENFIVKYKDIEKYIDKKLFQVTTEFIGKDCYCDTTTLYYKGEAIIDIYI